MRDHRSIDQILIEQAETGLAPINPQTRSGMLINHVQTSRGDNVHKSGISRNNVKQDLPTVAFSFLNVPTAFLNRIETRLLAHRSGSATVHHKSRSSQIVQGGHRTWDAVVGTPQRAVNPVVVTVVAATVAAVEIEEVAIVATTDLLPRS